MANCEEVLKKIYRYLDSDLDGMESPQVRKHLELCRHCFSYVEFERLLREHMRAKTDHACPEKLKKKIQGLIESF